MPGETKQADVVGGMCRVSMPVGDGKGSPWMTLESSFELTCGENTAKGRQSKRTEGWKELQEDLQNQIAETLASIKSQVGG